MNLTNALKSPNRLQFHNQTSIQTLLSARSLSTIASASIPSNYTQKLLKLKYTTRILYVQYAKERLVALQLKFSFTHKTDKDDLIGVVKIPILNLAAGPAHHVHEL